jgi:hypothetical protein
MIVVDNVLVVIKANKIIACDSAESDKRSNN